MDEYGNIEPRFDFNQALETLAPEGFQYRIVVTDGVMKAHWWNGTTWVQSDDVYWWEGSQ